MNTILLLAALTLQPDTGHVRTENVTYLNGSLKLAAELISPKQPGRHPAAVIIQGSGTSDRTNSWARAIAQEIAAAGFHVLLTDKRGSGQSAGSWMTAGFDDLAQDALAGIRFLRTRDNVDTTRIGLAGLSQGGWIAPLAAARSDDVAFVINISGATVSFAEQNHHEMANTARQAGLDEAGVQGILALNRAVARYLLTDEWAPYAAARTRALDTPWGKVAAGYPADSTLPIWTFLRKVAPFDPVPYWTQLSVPALIVYGEDDERDNVPVAESVRRITWAFGAAGKTNYRTVVVPGVGHGLIDPGTRQLATPFTAALRAWLTDNVLRR